MSESDNSLELARSILKAKVANGDAERVEATARRHERGLLTARERVESLLDADSFMESGALVAPDRSMRLNADVEAPADGVIVGSGRVEGNAISLVAQDYTVLGGSIGAVGDRKICRTIDQAVERGQPLVMLLEGGGHRIQDGMDAAHFAAASPVFSKLSQCSGWVPTISAIMGQGFAGPTAYASLADFVVMIRGQSTMGIAGPALVKAGTGEEVSKEELGGAQRQADRNGIADLAVDDEAQCLQAIQKYLSYFPSNATAPLPIQASSDSADRRCDALIDLVPANGRRVYDMREVIHEVVDTGSVFELKPGYAANMLTCLARLDGRPVGIIANQPLRKGGVLNAAACEKAAHFIAVCDAFGLPLVSLIDIPGIAIGPQAEDTGIARRSGRLFYEMAMASVPLISVVLRKGYGGGYYAMGGGRGFDAVACLAWPTADICAMSIEGAVDIAYRRDYEKAEDPAAARQQMIEDIRQHTGALKAAEDFGVDDVIDPRDTRRLLIEIFAQCPRRRHKSGPPRHRSISPI